MAKTIQLSGDLTISAGGCAVPGADAILLGIGAPGCPGQVFYETCLRSGQQQINTGAVLGNQFVDLDCLDGLTGIELLYIRSTAPVQLRIDPTRPEVASLVAVPAIGLAAGVLAVTVRAEDATEYSAAVDFSTTPAANAAAVANALNGALGAVGAVTPPDGPIVRIGAGGALTVTAPGIGPLSRATLTDAGTILGGTVTADGTSTDEEPFSGLLVKEFRRAPNAPTKIQISGQASIDVMGAGRSS